MIVSTVFLAAVLAGRDAAPLANAVVLPASPTESQREAARELTTYLKRITGNGPAMTVRIEAGGPDLGDDGFRLQMKDGALRIAGGKRGVLYGVYEVLERFGGCGWFSPAVEVVPRKDAVEIPDGLDETHRPAFAMRTTSWGAVAAHPRFAARMRINGATHPRLPENLGGEAFPFVKGAGICHTFWKLMPPSVWFESHPEYFCEVDGRRRGGNETQPCLTNPDVLRIITSNVLERLAKEPDAKLVGISQMDNQMYCRCAKCAAVDEEEGSHAGTLVRFVNAVAEEVEKVRPDVLVQTLIYQYTRKPPKLTRLRHNVTPCLCSIECRRNVTLDDPSSPQNAAFMADMKAWAEISDHLYIWDYTTNYRNYLYPTPFERVFQPNMRAFRDNKVKYMFEEGTEAGQHADFGVLKTYLLAKWMWDPDLDEKTLTDRFFAGYFGAAAPFVREYYEKCRAESVAHADQVVGIFNAAPPRWYTPEVSAWARGRFAAAKAAVKDDPLRLKNVRHAELVPMTVELDRYAEKAKCFFVTRDPAKFPHRTDLDADYREVMEMVAQAKKDREPIHFAAGLCWEPCKLALWKTVYGGEMDRSAKDELVIRPGDLFIVSGRHAKTKGDGLHFLPSSGAAMAKLFFRNVAFDRDARYEVRFRAKVVKGDREGAAFRAALGPAGAKEITNLGEGTNAENALAVIEKRTDEVDGEWAWYAFPPVRLKESFAFEFGSGPWNHGGGTGATKEVLLDRVEIVRK